MVKKEATIKKLARQFVAAEEEDLSSGGVDTRDIPEGFDFSPKAIKPLSKTLWHVAVSMGHLLAASNRFNKIKSSTISPDGRLGGRGYVQEVKAIRLSIAKTIETLSAISDTLHDEITAAHWQPVIESLPDKEEDVIEEIIDEAEEVISDPEGKAVEEEAEDLPV